MKKSPLIHGLWIIAAIAAFVIGAQFPAGGKRTSNDGVPAGAGAGESGRQSGNGMTAEDGAASGKTLTALNERSSGDRPQQKPLTAKQIAALGEKFRTTRDPIARRLAFGNLIEGLTAENALEVREQIAHLDHRSAEFQEFHFVWGAVAGAEAALFGADTEEDDMAPALAGWASKDPEAARAWLEGLDMASDSRFDALLKERKIPEEDLRKHLMAGLVSGMAVTDPAAASQFVHALAANGETGLERMMHSVSEAVLRGKSPQETALWLGDLPDGRLRNVAMGPVVDRMVQRDPKGAIEWLSELPEAGGQRAGVEHAMSSWARRDPKAASEFLTEMPASPLRDEAVSAFSRRLVWEDPHSAMTWADSIASPEHRRQTQIAAGRSWLRKNRASASDWLQSSGLPPEVRQAILSPSQ